MGYHIPSDEQVLNSLEKVLREFRTVNSQNKLQRIVAKELTTKKKKFNVSASRLRNIAINSDFVKLEIHSREGDPKKLLEESKDPRVHDFLTRGGEGDK